MEHLQAREVADLHPAALAVGEDDLGFHPGDGLCQILTDLLRDVIFFLFESERPAHAAAIGLDVLNGQAGDEPEDLKGGKPDFKGAEMAGGKIGRPSEKAS